MDVLIQQHALREFLDAPHMVSRDICVIYIWRPKMHAKHVVGINQRGVAPDKSQ